MVQLPIVWLPTAADSPTNDTEFGRSELSVIAKSRLPMIGGPAAEIIGTPALPAQPEPSKVALPRTDG